MSIASLSFQGLRNLAPASLTPSSGINLLYGDNGSGKTSILEGIHVLGMGRSFRTRHIKHAVQHQSDAMTLFARLAHESVPSLGVRRRRDHAELELRVAGNAQARVAQLAEALPLQLINPDTFKLLEGSPAARREFIDWGVFHVKQDFFHHWKRARRALKHRNALLRRGRINPVEIQVWEQELAQSAGVIDQYRQAWFNDFLPVFEATIKALCALEGLSLHYARGWDKHRELIDVLAAGRSTDEQMGFTQQGPQRADLRIRKEKQAAMEVLSRGQQKLVVSALKLAQGQLLNQIKGRQCVYLVDDLPAELDSYHRLAFCQLLERMQAQAFVTSVARELLVHQWEDMASIKVFHVKQCSQSESDGREVRPLARVEEQ